MTKSIGLLADASASRRIMVFAPDSYREPSGQFYLNVTTRGRLPGLSHLDNFIMTRKSCPLTGTLQKLMPTLTQTATAHTTGPLCCNNILSSSARLPQIQFAGLPGQIDNSLTNPYPVTNPFSHDSRKQAYPSASLFNPDDKFVPSGQTLNLYFTRLAPLACIWQFTVLFRKKVQNRPMSTICKLSIAPASLLSLMHTGTT